MSKTNLSELEILLRARYPMIWINSYEEVRISRDLTELAKQRKMACSIWSVTKGFVNQNVPPVTSLSGAEDVGKALKLIEDAPSDIECLFIMKDINPFLNNPILVRQLRDVEQRLRQTRSSLVVISTTQKFPPELEKSFYVMDWDLPNRDEIRPIVGEILKLPKVKAPANLDSVVDAALGLTKNEIEAVLAKSAVQTATLDVGTIIAEKKQILKRGGILEFIEASGSLNDVGGHDLLKGWLQKRQRAFTPQAREYGIPLPKGTLIVGPPGAGKSLIAKMAGNAWGMPTLRLDMGRVFQGLVGSSEENMRKAIKQAEACAPCVLWIDELEKGLGQGGLDGGTSQRVFGTFLTWMQEKTCSVFVMATANNISNLPPELLRKGRFDEIWYCNLPTLKERAEILKIHLSKKAKAQDLPPDGLEKIAKITKGYVGAELEAVVVSAMYEAFDEDGPVRIDHLIRACEETTPLSRTMEGEITRIREWAHKAGIRSTTSSSEDETKSIQLIDLS